MGFDFNKEKQAAAEEAATAKWDKARMFHEKIIGCVRTIEEIENPWYDEKKNPAPTLYTLSFAFLFDGHRNTIDTTYRVTPEMRILVARFPMPWHNMRWTRYQTKAGSYGYELDQVTIDDARCPWEQAARGKVAVAELPPAASDYVDGVAEILDGYGFEGPAEVEPITEATATALLRAAAMMMSTFGVRIDPGDVAAMSEMEGRKRLADLRRQWATQSATKAKSSL